jgi:GNAT superfamily N-acetyltransferase
VGTVTVRSARPEDLPRLVELLEFGSLVEGKEDRADGPAYASALDEIRATPGCDVLVAEADGEVVGTCQLIVFRHLQSRGGRCAEIESMHVHPDHRGRGIGSQLLGAAVDAARQAGCYRIQLTSNRQRLDAHRFYEREGLTASHVGFKRHLGPT